MKFVENKQVNHLKVNKLLKPVSEECHRVTDVKYFMTSLQKSLKLPPKYDPLIVEEDYYLGYR